MEEALRFFRAYEIWIYLLLGLGGLIYIRKFTLAWQELRDSAFGLERENAQSRLNQAASVLVLLLALAVTQFVLVSFVAPSVPGANPLFTPTLDLLATPSTTLPPETPGPEGTPATATATQEIGISTPDTGCIPGQVMITSPEDGDEISGIVDIMGTANIPNFGFYKLEMKRTEETNWLTILAGDEAKINDTLGTWNTSLLSPGNHQLSLVVADNQGQTQTPCIIQVRVETAIETPLP